MTAVTRLEEHLELLADRQVLAELPGPVQTLDQAKPWLQFGPGYP